MYLFMHHIRQFPQRRLWCVYPPQADLFSFTHHGYFTITDRNTGLGAHRGLRGFFTGGPGPLQKLADKHAGHENGSCVKKDIDGIEKMLHRFLLLYLGARADEAMSCPPMPPIHYYVGACSLRSQCPHTPASHWQSQMTGSALGQAKPDPRLITNSMSVR